MMKRIVVCCDGTWKARDSEQPSNVEKLADLIKPQGADGVEQVVGHFDGVGAKRPFLERITGGAFGHGLDAKVREAYTHVATAYEAGDEIYLFGFSRGAYTARSALGMIRKCGLLKEPTEENVRRAYAFYRNDVTPASDAAKKWRQKYAVEVDLALREPHVPVVEFIGVWDTVGALGVPFYWSRKRYQFHDVALTSWVNNAYHALAIDEQRKDFEPTLWEQDPAETRQQTIEQRWFAGTHSDVGGGIGGGALQQSDRCLAWIAERAKSCGLDMKGTTGLNAVEVETPSCEQLGDIHLGMPWPFTWWAKARPGGPRPIGAGVSPEDSRYGGLGLSHEVVNPSVVRRQLCGDPPYIASSSLHHYWNTHPQELDAAKTALGI